MAWIALEGVRFFGYHGYYEEESVLGTEFVLNVYVEFDPDQRMDSDRLETAVNYESLYRCCNNVMRGPRKKLIETLAVEICKAVKSHHPSVLRVKTKVQKQHPPLAGRVDSSWTEFEL